MSNEGILGLTEALTPQIYADQVNFVKQYTRTSKEAALPPGQSLEFEFYVHNFPISLSVGHRDLGSLLTTARVIDPSPTRPTDVFGEPGPIPGVMARMRLPDIPRGGDWDLEIPPVFPPPDLPDPIVPFEIVLTPPAPKPALTYINPKASEIDQWPPQEVVGRIAVDLREYRGWWRISVKNINAVSLFLHISLSASFASTSLLKGRFSLPLFNRLAKVAMAKLAPNIGFSSGVVTAAFTYPFSVLVGDQAFSLPGIVGSVLTSAPTFRPLSAKLMSVRNYKSLLLERKTDTLAGWNQLIAQSHDNNVRNYLIGKKNKAASLFDSRIQSVSQHQETHLALVIEGLFSQENIDIKFIGEAAQINNLFPQLGVIFDEYLQPVKFVSTLSVDLSPLYFKLGIGLVAVGLVLATSILAPLGIIAIGVGAFMAIFGGDDEVDLDQIINAELRKHKEPFAALLKESIGRFLGYQSYAHSATVDGEMLNVAYYSVTINEPPRNRPRLRGGVVTPELDAVTMQPGFIEPARPVNVTELTSMARLIVPGEVATTTGGTLDPETPVSLPEDFIVSNPETLGRLDQHKSIVLIMMENRSFDHMFYNLASELPGRGYASVPTSYSNPPGPGFGHPVFPMPRTSLGLDKSLIYIDGHWLDPSHNLDHTLFQIGNGTEEGKGTGEMKGFVRDFSRSSDASHLVLSYFQMPDLPTYSVLARHFSVCDNWYAALPAGTHPNRLAALQGDVPSLYNFHVGDPGLGYLKDRSIMDVLSYHGVSWMAFESDYSTLRMYDRYRLETQKIRPIGDLDAVLHETTLPRFMVIEPSFFFGNDDHPPMSVQAGQDFIREVIGSFVKADRLKDVMLVITYDEHGGFFDHIAPPGTVLGDHKFRGPDGISVIPKLHPEAPACMGVRVPSMVISPFVDVAAEHTVFDHTSVLKTVLLHNRRAIQSSYFGAFGKRVQWGNHLGQALTRTIPRIMPNAELASALGINLKSRRVGGRPNVLFDAKVAQMDATHHGNVMANLLTPRGRTIR